MSTRRKGSATATVTVKEALGWLERRGTKQQAKELDRYGITATRPFGVSMGDLRKYAKEIGKSHELGQELWATGRYEARLLATLVDEPVQVTVGQMNAWISACDNWALVDTLCFQLFDRTAHAWGRVPQWAKAKPEFKKRGAFALLWALSVHDKEAPDKQFRDGLKLIVAEAHDDRHFVKKAVNMALRAIGKRNRALNGAAIETAQRLAKVEHSTCRWIGTHALRELQSGAVQRRLARESRR